MRHLLLLALTAPAAAQCNTVFSWDFTGSPPAGTSLQTSGLWHITTVCKPGGGGSGGEFAYYGQDAGCNFDVGVTAGVMSIGPINLPNASRLLLGYAGAYEGESCGFCGCCDFDYSYVVVSPSQAGGNAETVDVPCGCGYDGTYQNRWVDITHWGGQSVHVRFEFHTEDGFSNHWFGQAVDDLTILADCETGTPYCSSAQNSTGQVGATYLWGSASIAEDDMRLVAEQLPNEQWGYFLMSQSQDSVPGFGGSQGTLCLGAPIIRFNVPPWGGVHTVQNHMAHLALDPGDLPQGYTFQPGETWNFQFWHRDFNPLATSNTTTGYAVTFQ